MKPLEERYRARRQSVEIRPQAERGAMAIDLLRQALGHRSSRVRQFVVQQSEMAEQDEVTIVLARIAPRDALEVVAQLRRLPIVKSVRDIEP